MEKMELILEIENAYNKKMEFVENSNTRFSDLLADKTSNNYLEYLSLNKVYNRLEKLYTKKYR